MDMMYDIKLPLLPTFILISLPNNIYIITTRWVTWFSNWFLLWLLTTTGCSSSGSQQTSSHQCKQVPPKTSAFRLSLWLWLRRFFLRWWWLIISFLSAIRQRIFINGGDGRPGCSVYFCCVRMDGVGVRWWVGCASCGGIISYWCW